MSSSRDEVGDHSSPANGFVSSEAAGRVRRTDLRLRARYPQLDTRIFEIEPGHYVIVFDAALLVAETVAEEFGQRIRPISLWVDLSNEVPISYLAEIPGIADKDASLGLEGMSATSADLGNLLAGKIPSLPRFSMDDSRSGMIVLLMERALTEKERSEVGRVINGAMPGWPFDITVSPPARGNEADRTGYRNERSFDVAIQAASFRRDAPPFARGDEAFWYDNIDAIFQGKLGARSIPAVQDAGMACYLDATWAQQIDLRQAVLLYDTVYLSPPGNARGDARSAFWDTQEISRDGFLQLVEAGRIRLVLRQPEEHTDPRLLAEVWERNPSAVIGRRTAAAIVAADIVQTAEDYVLARPEFRGRITLVAQALAEAWQLTPDTVTRILLWPLCARRECILPLWKAGLLGVANFGQGDVVAAELSSVLGRDYKLEAVSTLESVHVAHALGATCIPPLADLEGWLAPRRMIADRLNFYRGFTARTAATWATNERRKEERVSLLPPLPMFQFNRHAPIDDLIAFTSRPSTRRKGRALVSRLAALPAEEREAERERLLAEMYRLQARRKKKEMVVDVAGGIADIAGAGVDVSLSPLTGIWTMLKTAVGLARRNPKLDSFADEIAGALEGRTSDKDDLAFLDSIERVASLRETRAS